MRGPRIPARLSRFVPRCALAVAALSWVAGCTRTTTITLNQPFAPHAQQSLRLESRWAFSDARDGRAQYLLAFPLPGAEAGPRDFLVYVDAPDRSAEIAIAADEPAAARGFLIQAVGELRGRTAFSGGRLRRSDVLLQPRRKRLELDFTCADGTRIFGTAFVEHSTYELGAFESRYAADVATLAVTPASHPTTTQSAN